ncbi:Catechol O-methyltransferase [Oligella sp. MSHR50489EDL]|uniref:O-methyltransferase n=1 Tax=Oligella sp. MSHR50489EDL TaxID=3139409 RepID=UPI003D8159F2
MAADAKSMVDLKQAAAVDDYFYQHLIAQDTLLAEVLERSNRHPIPFIHVSPTQGKFLKLLVQMMGAQRVLEIGTLAAYSTIWMGLAVPEGGKIITLDFDEKHVAIARDNIAFAGMSDKIEVIQGAAADTLQRLIDEGCEPFDFVFIDADKGNNPLYLELSLKLSRPGTVIIGDNVVRHGKVLDEDARGSNIQGLRSFFELMSNHPQLDATAIQTVGAKSWDGFSMAIVK